VRYLTELFGLRVSVETHVAPTNPKQFKRCQRFRHTQRNCGYPPWCVVCGEKRLSGECSTPTQLPKCCSCEDNHTANYQGCSKWKEVKAALAKREQTERKQANGATRRPAAPKYADVGPSLEQDSLGLGSNHIIQGGHVVKATLPYPPEPSPRSVAEDPQQSKVTEPKKGGKAANPALRATKPLGWAAVTNAHENVKTRKSSFNV
jgi:hypothetical protein